MEFTYDCYLRFTNKLARNGYSLVRFKDKNVEGPTALLRHDVDVSPQKAMEMAELESMNGIISTYFFMLNSSTYNIFEAKAERCLKRIADLGHEIGLHFDASGCKDFEEGINHKGRLLCLKKPHIPVLNIDIEKKLMHEHKILSEAIGARVESISFHIPKKSIIGRDFHFMEGNGLNNAYGKELFCNTKYVSDSMMRWRENPEDYIDKENYPKLQILTHPIWWSDCNKALSGEKEANLILMKEEIRIRKNVTKYMDKIYPGYTF